MGMDVVTLGAGVSAMGAHWKEALGMLQFAQTNQVEPCRCIRKSSRFETTIQDRTGPYNIMGEAERQTKFAGEVISGR